MVIGINELRDLDDLAKILGIRLNKLTYILYKQQTNNLYNTFTIPKQQGGVRTINAPKSELKLVQRKLAKILTKHYHDIYPERKNKNSNLVSHGFEVKKGIITNAKNHRKKRTIINIDIDDYFGSFHFGRVKGFFEKNKYFTLPEIIAIALAQLTCYKGKLPQGAPTSPIISNFIMNILDMRILNLSKKYKLYYTRYADDLTFSTNDRNIDSLKDSFLVDLKDKVEKFGFSINDKKTRIIYSHNRQDVTGITVNDKVNSSRSFRKETRAMLHSLYRTGEFYINDEKGTIEQLEGRFSFINQLDKHNNLTSRKNDKNKISFHNLNSREKQYQKFLFYKYFYSNENPLVITEGKTDVVYLKAALKNMYQSYPELVSKDANGNFSFKLNFLTRSKRLRYFMNISKDGGDIFQNIYNYYSDKGGKMHYPNYDAELRGYGRRAENNVIFLSDNEIADKDKPIYKFLRYANINTDKHKMEQLKTNDFINIKSNLYLLTNPLVNGLSVCEIEDLFTDKTLSTKIAGKKFSRIDKIDVNRHYGKEIFSNYIMNNYQTINFEEFKGLLNNIIAIQQYKN